MAGIQKFSENVIDAAERLADVADAAQGKGARKRNSGVRWMILPAAGAGLYALVTSRSFPRQAKGVLKQARARASDLPDDLFGRVQQATGLANGQKSTRQPARKSRSGSSSSSNRQRSSTKTSSSR